MRLLLQRLRYDMELSACTYGWSPSLAFSRVFFLVEYIPCGICGRRIAQRSSRQLIAASKPLLRTLRPSAYVVSFHSLSRSFLAVKSSPHARKSSVRL